MRRHVRLLLPLVLGGCAVAPRPPAASCPAPGAVVYVVDHGWHTDLGIPAPALRGPLAVFRDWFPGARAFLFGFGKRTFFTARVDSWQEYLLGPVPGPAAILVTGLRVLPDAAYRAGSTLTLPVPSGGMAALSAFVWRSLAHDRSGRPRLIAAGPYPGSLFYAATPTYWLGNTCNTWTAEALHLAGTEVTSAGVAFASQVMARARAARCAVAGR